MIKNELNNLDELLSTKISISEQQHLVALQKRRTSYEIPILHNINICYEVKIEHDNYDIPFLIVEWRVEIGGAIENDAQSEAVKSLIKAFPAWEKDVVYNCILDCSWMFKNKTW